MKPYELIEAEMVWGMCRAFHCLPRAGGLLDQPVSLLRMRGILSEAGYFDSDGGGIAAADLDDPFAGLPMVGL